MSIRARALSDWPQVPLRSRLTVYAEGATLLGEHVDSLRQTVQLLIDQGENRGARILDITASEEAAKVLILLDLARVPLDDEDSIKRLCRAFYNHTARGVYGMAHLGTPAHFGELRERVEWLRQSYYVVGAEWTFRNDVDAIREEAFYVDFVYDEDTNKHYWISPATDMIETILGWRQHPVTKLVSTMREVGLLSAEGFAVVADIWRGVTLEDTTRSQVFEQKNAEVLTQLQTLPTWPRSLQDRDIRWFIDQWAFPLGSLDTTRA